MRQNPQPPIKAFENMTPNEKLTIGKQKSLSFSILLPTCEDKGRCEIIPNFTITTLQLKLDKGYKYFSHTIRDTLPISYNIKYSTNG